MKITQIRNATVVVEFGEYRILIDPMLAPKYALPPLKLSGGRQRNPVVDLPHQAESVLESATHCLITHCQKGHFDHLDRAGKRWLRDRATPVICTPHDAPFLRKRGLNALPLPADHHQPHPFLTGQIRTVPCVHGTGIVGSLMEHGVGYFIEMPGEPSLYISGDTILSPDVLGFVAQHRPQVSLVPAGGARFDVGGEIIMGLRAVVAFAQASTGTTIANHLEALSHCPVKRSELLAAAAQTGLSERLLVPADGEMLEFGA